MKRNLTQKTPRPPRKIEFVKTLTELTPKLHGDVDISLIDENLRLTPTERIEAACRAANGLESLRAALKAARG